MGHVFCDSQFCGREDHHDRAFVCRFYRTFTSRIRSVFFGAIAQPAILGGSTAQGGVSGHKNQFLNALCFGGAFIFYDIFYDTLRRTAIVGVRGHAAPRLWVIYNPDDKIACDVVCGCNLTDCCCVGDV